VARFGWVVGPERQGPAPWQHSLSVQEAELGALVAVPSWWRTVLLRICTGFVKGSNLPSITSPDVALQDWLKDCCIEILRLPGTSLDVSRRLGLDVVKFPYLLEPKGETTLVAGQAGKLLLEGGRLWRSTVVMLGNQRAKQIEVLPDMQGVLAFFDCVERPVVRLPVEKDEVTVENDEEVRVPVSVWTSEGSTPPFPVKVKVGPDHFCPSDGTVPVHMEASSGRR
jgi:hypothetical protein